ncbi:hypothetical protein HU200_017951 [Digitaria exilis]|uniref:DUF7036 domain-containing protein n=1 Tax=Digitaria exilis TaxID=1010633 RepID=A0A835F5D4_9POAL|nr:hypothetical protein HU200_017951 [Digitaria exilis]
MISELSGNKSKLEYDIFEEIGTNNSAVSVLSLDPTGESNWTTVTFGVWPYPNNFTLSPTELSILRSSLVSLVIQQSILHLTPSRFGNSSSLNDKLSELKAQMKSGLFLSEHEILYVTLTNLYGSTVVPPTVVQTSVLLAVGADNKPPSLQRLKQLAQTLRNSSSGNLGLNHTVFGRVKQISLSSYLQHSLNNSGNAHSPSPAPQPYNHDHRHHHHHIHHHHHHHHDHSHQSLQHLAPVPAPLRSTPTFQSCGSTCARKKENSTAKHHSSPMKGALPIVPAASPNSYGASGPYVDPPSLHPRISTPPLRAVIFHAIPPNMGTSKPPNKFSSISPAASACELFFF